MERRVATPDREAVEALAHSKLADCRLPASELFLCDVAKGRRAVEAAILECSLGGLLRLCAPD